ncbi:hypothetical protein J6590_082536 [Homalodisca vitripennis]|nr:hypothetical protein J6590_082536 [Homalodisca vitripennis]
MNDLSIISTRPSVFTNARKRALGLFSPNLNREPYCPEKISVTPPPPPTFDCQAASLLKETQLHFDFIVVQRVESVAFADLTPGIWSHVCLKMAAPKKLVLITSTTNYQQDQNRIKAGINATKLLLNRSYHQLQIWI